MVSEDRLYRVLPSPRYPDGGRWPLPRRGEISSGPVRFPLSRTAWVIQLRVTMAIGERTSCYYNVSILSKVTTSKNCWIGPNVFLDGSSR
jgi:hypothetical protein